MEGMSYGGGLKVIVLNDAGNKVEVSADDISQFLRDKIADIRKGLLDFFKERGCPVGFGINILDINEGELFFKIKISVSNYNKAKLISLLNDQCNAYSRELIKISALAKELGIEPKEFDHKEWNEFALEISRKALVITGNGPIEVDPRIRTNTP